MFDVLIEKQDSLFNLTLYTGVFGTLTILMLTIAGFLMCRPNSKLGYVILGKKLTILYISIVVVFSLLTTVLFYEAKQTEKEVASIKQDVIQEVTESGESVTKEEVLYYHVADNKKCPQFILDGEECIKVYFKHQDDAVAVAFTLKSNENSLKNEKEMTFKVVDITRVSEELHAQPELNELDEYFNIKKYFYLN